jgi:predicted NAD/FAD-binding protein
MKIAIIGSGISGLVAAHRLHSAHEITLFEASSRAGGHTRTSDVRLGGDSFSVDMGFIVYNEQTYPGLVRLFESLGVATQETEMSFGVRCDRTGLEWGSRGIRGVAAQPGNLLRPSFVRMLRDIFRFNREAPQLLATPQEKISLGDYVRGAGYGDEFVEHYLVPMGAAIWSASVEDFLHFPAATFVRFFHNHGLLSTSPDLSWRVVQGGSARYVERLIAPFSDRLRIDCPVLSVRRSEESVTLETANGIERFDEVILAVHSDQALALLDDPSEAERAILSAIRYQENHVVLHTDGRFLPSREAARAAWNYRIPRSPSDRVFVTYDMNRLQRIESERPLLVTLNSPEPIDSQHILDQFTTQHPVFDARAAEAQSRWDEISGLRRTHYCGAYWRFGFHEDGLQSALSVSDSLQGTA